MMMQMMMTMRKWAKKSRRNAKQQTQCKLERIYSWNGNFNWIKSKKETKKKMKKKKSERRFALENDCFISKLKSRAKCRPTLSLSRSVPFVVRCLFQTAGTNNLSGFAFHRQRGRVHVDGQGDCAIESVETSEMQSWWSVTYTRRRLGCRWLVWRFEASDCVRVFVQMTQH